MVDSSVGRVLHGQHPFQVIVHLVQQIGRVVSAFRDVHPLTDKIVRKAGINRLHQSDGISGVHNVLVIISGIIPSSRRRNHRSRLTFRPGSIGMYQHLVIWMACRTAPPTRISRFDGHTRTLVIERFQSGIGQRGQHLFLYFECH